MPPVEIMSQNSQALAPAGNNNNQGGSIQLSMLIDFIVQRTYHDLVVLAELLPRKTDMEKKIGEFHGMSQDPAESSWIYFYCFRNLQFRCENPSALHQTARTCEMGEFRFES